MTDERTIDWRLAILAVALCIVILTVSYVAHTPIVGYDGSQYLTFAANLLKTGSFTYDGVTPSAGRAPGYPAFLAVVIHLTGGTAAVYPIQLLFLLFAYGCIASAFRRVLTWPWTLGLLVALTTVWPVHRLAMALTTEPLFLAITSAGLLLTISYGDNHSWPKLVGAAFCLAISSYVRPVNALAPILLAGFLIWRRHFSIARAAAFAAAGIITIAPWTVRNAIEFHRLIPMAAHFGSVYYMTDSDSFWPILFRSAGASHSLPAYKKIVGDDFELSLEANDRYWAQSLVNIKSDPIGFLFRCVVKSAFVVGYLPGTKGWIFTYPALFGLGVALQCSFWLLAWLGWKQVKHKSPALASVITGYAGYTLLVLFPFYAESRFWVPVYLWLCGFVWVWMSQLSPPWSTTRPQ